MRPYFPGLAAACLFVSTMAMAQTPPLPSRTHDWSDITEVVVRAPSRGPAMWKIQKGNATVWVLGVLPQTPNGLHWDQARLKRLMRESKSIILPGRAFATVEGHTRWREGDRLVKNLTLMTILSDTARKRFYDAAERERRYEHESFDFVGRYFQSDPPVRAGDEFYTLVTRYHDIGSRVALDILDMANQSPAVKVVPYETNIDYLTDDWMTLNEADGETCLNDFLDDVDYDLTTLPDEAEAWAKGDMPTLLRTFRDTPGLGCDLLVPEWRKDYELLHLQKVTGAIDNALAEPALNVAIVPLSDLLMKNGILDRLRGEEGVTITSPAD